MFPFTLYLPTRIYAGKDCVENLPAAVKGYGRNVLIAYGSGSVIKSGMLDRVEKLLKGYNITRLSGITPNPKLEMVKKGVRLVRDNRIDFIISLGGSSVLDCVKHISASAFYDGDPWDLITAPFKIEKTIPLFAVMSMAATGSEYDNAGVISNEDTHEKLLVASDKLFPVASFLDPTYTYTVPDFQTASGAADIISHVFEQYFVADTNTLTDGFCEAMLRTVIENTPKAIAKHDDYESRFSLMMASAFGCCGLLSMARAPSPWPCHAIEHELSAWYDITHGAGLAILIPNWMEFSLNDKTASRFAAYAREVFKVNRSGNDLEDAKKGIMLTRDFFHKIGLPAKLSELDKNITSEHFEEMAKHIQNAWWDLKNAFAPIDEKAIVTILLKSL